MRVLVTGAAGFIGSHASAGLLARGHEVIGLDSFDPYYDPAIKRRNIVSLVQSPRFRMVTGDIRDAALLKSLTAREPPDAIVHLAARAGVRASIEAPRAYVDVNLNGTVEVLEAARRHGVRRFVFASSSSVYGEREGAPFHEDDSVDTPVSPYAATKKAGELLCHTYHHLYGMDVVCLRFFTVYGPRQRPEMAIHLFTRLIDEGEPVKVFGDGTARRDFTYITDIVDGVMASIERARGFRVYNLGNNRTVELRELVRLIEDALGKKARLDFLPMQPGDVSLTCADISRAQEELGYHPSTPIEKGIEEFVAWFNLHKEIGAIPERIPGRAAEGPGGA
jgi:UDP-glucuronate 4-epimerase